MTFPDSLNFAISVARRFESTIGSQDEASTLEDAGPSLTNKHGALSRLFPLQSRSLILFAREALIPA
jgi:hypothetical protein